jgi:hypothetical protein
MKRGTLPFGDQLYPQGQQYKIVPRSLSTTRAPKEPCSTSRGAIRTARCRERTRRGYRIFLVEVSGGDIDRMVARGFLDRRERDDPTAVERASGALLDRL